MTLLRTARHAMRGLLARSDLFRAGSARRGAYNRTLTPFGFQAEPRTYRQAPDVYDQMSPFHVADTIQEPILMIQLFADSRRVRSLQR